MPSRKRDDVSNDVVARRPDRSATHKTATATVALRRRRTEEIIAVTKEVTENYRKANRVADANVAISTKVNRFASRSPPWLSV
jgi:hypothetical protein